MDFTKGKRRLYERLMKEKPGFERHHNNQADEEPPLQDKNKVVEGRHKKRTRKQQLEG